jgi:hypothetical protein
VWCAGMFGQDACYTEVGALIPQPRRSHRTTLLRPHPFGTPQTLLPAARLCPSAPLLNPAPGPAPTARLLPSSRARPHLLCSAPRAQQAAQVLTPCPFPRPLPPLTSPRPKPSFCLPLSSSAPSPHSCRTPARLPSPRVNAGFDRPRAALLVIATSWEGSLDPCARARDLPCSAGGAAPRPLPRRHRPGLPQAARRAAPRASAASAHDAPADRATPTHRRRRPARRRRLLPRPEGAQALPQLQGRVRLVRGQVRQQHVRRRGESRATPGCRGRVCDDHQRGKSLSRRMFFIRGA